MVTGAAVLAEGHIPKGVFEEMLLVLQPMGYAIFTTRVENLAKFGYGPAMEELVKKGLWKQVEVVNYNKYPNIEQGVTIGHFKQVECLCFVYQKL